MTIQGPGALLAAAILAIVVVLLVVGHLPWLAAVLIGGLALARILP